MFVQKDIYPQLIDTYIKAQNDATKIDYSKNYKIKPMKTTTNLIENSRMTGFKNAPIRNSDKQKPPIITPYSKFTGSKALPTFKEDLKHWKIIC